jgi:ATP-binding cassette subfamily B protein
VASSPSKTSLVSFIKNFRRAVALLYVGKLIIDQVVALNTNSPAGNLQNYGNWLPYIAYNRWIK